MLNTLSCISVWASDISAFSCTFTCDCADDAIAKVADNKSTKYFFIKLKQIGFSERNISNLYLFNG
jgi:hypothetical protein